MPYEWVWPEELSIHAKVTWSQLYTYDILNDGQAPEDETAYLYSLVVKLDREWWPMYIGMVYGQNVSSRLRAEDHQRKRQALQRNHRDQRKYRDAVVHLSLGTPEFVAGRRTKSNVRTVEHLLIYSNWHEKMLNKRLIQNFRANSQILVENLGFTSHLNAKSGYGVFNANDV